MILVLVIMACIDTPKIPKLSPFFQPYPSADASLHNQSNSHLSSVANLCWFNENPEFFLVLFLLDDAIKCFQNYNISKYAMKVEIILETEFVLLSNQKKLFRNSVILLSF